jgi:hypothetical protein
MYIEELIKLKNNIYYIVVDVEYKKINNGLTILCMKNYNDDYFDGGDLSKLIEKIEVNYSREKAQEYDENIGFMADVMYIYDRIPFLSGIRDVYISKKENLPTSIGYISKNEIEKYIKENNVNMQSKDNFKLSDESTWIV